MLFIAFYIAAQMSISDVHIHLITYKPYPIIIVCFLSYIISGCCHVDFCCVVCSAETRCLCYNSCQLYIPSIIHISTMIYFQFYLSIYTLVYIWSIYTMVPYKSSPNFQNSLLVVPLHWQHWSAAMMARSQTL